MKKSRRLDRDFSVTLYRVGELVRTFRAFRATNYLVGSVGYRTDFDAAVGFVDGAGLGDSAGVVQAGGFDDEDGADDRFVIGVGTVFGGFGSAGYGLTAVSRAVSRCADRAVMVTRMSGAGQQKPKKGGGKGVFADATALGAISFAIWAGCNHVCLHRAVSINL